MTAVILVVILLALVGVLAKMRGSQWHAEWRLEQQALAHAQLKVEEEDAQAVRALHDALLSALVARGFEAQDNAPRGKALYGSADGARVSWSVSSKRFNGQRWLLLRLELDHVMDPERFDGEQVICWARRLKLPGLFRVWASPLHDLASTRKDVTVQRDQLSQPLMWSADLPPGREPAQVVETMTQLLDVYEACHQTLRAMSQEQLIWAWAETCAEYELRSHVGSLAVLIEHSEDGARAEAFAEHLVRYFSSAEFGDSRWRWLDDSERLALLSLVSDAQIEAWTSETRASFWVARMAESRRYVDSPSAWMAFAMPGNTQQAMWRFCHARHGDAPVDPTDRLIALILGADETLRPDARLSALYDALRALDAAQRDGVLAGISCLSEQPPLLGALWHHLAADAAAQGELLGWCFAAGRASALLAALPTPTRAEVIPQIVARVSDMPPEAQREQLGWMAADRHRAALLIAQREQIAAWPPNRFEYALQTLWRPGWSGDARETDLLLSQLWLHAPAEGSMRSDLLDLLKHHGAAASLAALRHVASNGPDLPRAIDARAGEIADWLEATVGLSEHDGMLTLAADGPSGGLSVVGGERGGLSATD